MHDDGDPMIGDNLADGADIANVAFDERNIARNGRAMARREVVEDDDGITGLA